MKIFNTSFSLLLACLLVSTSIFAEKNKVSTVSKAPQTTSTADHSTFKELQQDFASGPEVTKACLTCHTEASKQLHKTSHWTWAFENKLTGQTLGKKNVINNLAWFKTTSF